VDVNLRDLEGARRALSRLAEERAPEEAEEPTAAASSGKRVAGK
jgi:hypothetical protein